MHDCVATIGGHVIDGGKEETQKPLDDVLNGIDRSWNTVRVRGLYFATILAMFVGMNGGASGKGTRSDLRPLSVAVLSLQCMQPKPSKRPRCKIKQARQAPGQASGGERLSEDLDAWNASPRRDQFRIFW